MQQPAERPLPHRRDVDGRALAADHHRVEAPLRLAVAPGRALEQLGGRGDTLAVGRVRERIERVLEVEPRDIGQRPRRLERGVARFVQPVEAVREDRPAGGRRAAKFPDCHAVGPPALLLRRSIVTKG